MTVLVPEEFGKISRFNSAGKLTSQLLGSIFSNVWGASEVGPTSVCACNRGANVVYDKVLLPPICLGHSRFAAHARGTPHLREVNFPRSIQLKALGKKVRRF